MSRHDDTRRLLESGLGDESVAPGLRARIEATMAEHRSGTGVEGGAVTDDAKLHTSARPITSRWWAPVGIAAAVALLVGGTVAMAVTTDRDDGSPAATTPTTVASTVVTESLPADPTDPAGATGSAPQAPPPELVWEDFPDSEVTPEDWANPGVQPTVKTWRASLVLVDYTDEQLQALGLERGKYTEQDLRDAYAASWDAEAFGAEHCGPELSAPSWGDANAIPLVRTDFSDDAAWTAACTRAADFGSDEEDGWRNRAHLTPMSADVFAQASVPEVATAARAAGYAGRFVFVADRSTMADPDHSILAIDLEAAPVRTTRLPPSGLWVFDPVKSAPIDSPGVPHLFLDDVAVDIGPRSNASIELLAWENYATSGPESEETADHPEPPVPLDADGAWDPAGWLTDWCRPTTPGPGLPPVPYSEYSYWVIRTDFSSDAGWDESCGPSANYWGTPEDGYDIDSYPINSAEFDGASTDELVAAATDAGYPGFSLVVADRTTMTDPERTLLVVDLFGEPGRTARVIPEAVPDFTLGLSEVSWEEVMFSADPDGIYRGVDR